MSAATPRIGDLLIEAGAITQDQLSQALRHQATAGGRLGSNLVELGFIDERTLAGVLSRQLRIPSASAGQIDRISREVLALVPAAVAERLRAVPLREDAGKLWVAMAEPTDVMAIAELERTAKRPIRTMVAPELLIQYGLERHYQARRRPRVVEVRSVPSDMVMVIEGSGRPAPSAAAGPSAAPVYEPLGVSPEALARLGYLDEGPARPPAPVASGPPPVPVRPGAPPARLELDELARQLASAASDETVLDLAIRFIAADVQRVAALVLKEGELHGWRGAGVDQGGLGGVRVPLTDLPTIAQTLSTGAAYVGRLQPFALQRFAAPLGIDGEVLGVIVPVRIGSRAVGCIIGADASLEALRRGPQYDRLAVKIDQALHINYLRRQLLGA